MSPSLNGSSAIRHFEGNDVIEIHGGITFDFYMGLPHMQFLSFVIEPQVVGAHPLQGPARNSLTIDLVYTPSLSKIV